MTHYSSLRLLALAALISTATTSKVFAAGPSSESVLFRGTDPSFGNKQHQQRFLQDAEVTSEATYSAFSECQSYLQGQNKIGRTRLTKFLTDAVTSQADLKEYQDKVWDEENSVRNQFIPPFYSTSVKVFRVFATHVCKNDESGNEEVAAYCKNQDSANIEDLPFDARIVFKNMDTDDVNMAVINICSEMEAKFDRIKENVKAYYDTFDFDNVIIVQEDENDEGGSEDDGIITTVMDFDIRVDDESFESKKALKNIVRSEIRRLVKAGLGESDGSRRFRRVLEGAIGEVNDISVDSMSKVECTPAAENGVSCYDGKVTINIKPTDSNMSVENIQSTVISSIKKDQMAGAYFSYLDGFHSLPEGFVPSSNVEANTASKGGLSAFVIAAIVCTVVGTLLICAVIATIMVKKRRDGVNGGKNKNKNEIDEQTANDSPTSHRSGGFGLDSDDDDSSKDSSDDDSSKDSSDSSDDESEKNDLFNSKIDQPNFMVDISSASNLSRSRSNNSTYSQIEMVLSQDMRDELNNPAPAEEIRRRRSQSVAKEGRWVTAVDAESGDIYYYHTVTKEVTWDRPM